MEDVTLVGVMRRAGLPLSAEALVTRAGDEGEEAAVVQRPLQLYEAFVYGCNHTDVYVRVPPIDFNRHSIENMVLEMAL